MKKFLLAASLSIIAGGASADEAATSAHQLSGSATVVSDYIFRGMTQTWGQPALQGSIDYGHSSGLFASLWASTVSKKVIAGANAEIDLSLGYKSAINDCWSYGGGLISVYYPGGNWSHMKWGDRPNQKYDFTEANVFIGYQWLTIKYSQTLTDLIGFNEKTGFSGSTRGSSYVELNADIPVMDTGFVFGLHAGRQDIKATAGGVSPDFNDYRLSLSKTFGVGWSATVQLTENTNTAFLNGTRSNLNENDTRDVGERSFVIALAKSF